MKRCTKCILPENYPGITFNEEGVCNHCINFKKNKYYGSELLKEKIDSFLKNKKDSNKNYNCVLALSGGRDSSYMLYYLVKILNLKVLAYSVDHGFIPEQTKLNMKNMTDILNVKLVIEEHDFLKKVLKHHILSWMHKPSPAMVGVLCTGCRYNLERKIRNFAKKNKISLFFTGDHPFETQTYKFDIMKINPNVSGRNKCFFILGYLSQIIRNPKWILNIYSLVEQSKEFYNYYPIKIKKSSVSGMAPFISYIKWDEKEVISTIKNKLNWKECPNIDSTSRGDCDIALLKLYLYKKTLGFNDKDDDFSILIRSGQLSRVEALERLKKEEISEEVIKEIFDKLGLNYLDLKSALRQSTAK
ncbi:MAG: hypothetical protein JW924_01315 [Fusobacteriaceae bacterium]|nr:hypothetical protein [Fusobacteriaceae bacterium]